MKTVTGAIIVKDKKVLILRRAPSEAFAGYWEFPGGKIEENETPEHCLVRELKEELNIEATVKRFFCESVYRYAHGEIQLLAYIAEIGNDSIKLTVHDQLAWAGKENLLDYELLPADITVARKIVRELL